MASVPTVDLSRVGTEPVSTEPYISPAYFELERDRIFRRVWLFALRVEENAGARRLRRQGLRHLRCLGPARPRQG